MSFRVIAADFIGSFYSLHALQSFRLPEIAFVGRSNVGKSTILNALCQRRALARTSKTPGRTQALNFFQITYEEQDTKKRKQCHFVDLPGYGYSKVAKELQEQWKTLLGTYLLERESLYGVVLLIDSRRKIEEEERYLLELGCHGGLQLVLTKCDQVSKIELRTQRARIAKELEIDASSIICTSVGKGRGNVKSGGEKIHGLEDLRSAVFGDLLRDT